MNKTKNILLASTLSLLGLTLASCSKQEVRNQEIPYDDISSSKIVASVTTGDKTINVSEKEVFNKLRYNFGLQVFNNKIDELLYGQELEQVKYEGKVKTDIDEEICNAVYGTTELPKLKLMKADDLKLARKKFVDKMARQGLHVTEDELVFDPITKTTENVSFSKLSPSTIEHYKLSQAKKLRGKEYINSICDKEYIEKDGKNIKNKYYIDDKKIEAQYESSYRRYNTAKGIILRFNNLHDAKEAIENVSKGGLSEANLEQQYVDLYNNYYNYESEDLTVGKIGENENTIFETNSEVSQLKAFSSSLETLFIDELENGKGLLNPINIDDKYYLVYRKDLVFKTGETEDIPYNQLETKLGAEKFKEIKKNLKDDIIDNESTNVTSSIYSEDLESKELKIYDPFLENSFAGSNSFYEYVTTCESKYIFNSNDSKFKYTTKEFYEDLLQYDVDSTVVNLVLNKYLYDNEKSYLEKDEEKKFREELDTEVKEFNKGNKNLNKAYGETNFLFFQYGCTSKEEVVIQKAASAIKSDYIVDFVKNNWANDDHTINKENAKVLEKLIESAKEVLKEKKLFDINLDHILISVDNDQDGNPDNMLEFMDTLSADEKKKFEEAITELSRAISKEVEAIARPNTKEKLDYIVEAFNNNYPTCDGKSWADYKKYHFTLKAEELGNIDEGSVNNFVTEFKEYVEELFDKACRQDLKIEYDKEKDGRLYFTDRLDKDGKVVTEVNTKNFEAQDLCLTQFGYHMISLNSYKKDSTTLNFYFSQKQDTSNDYNNIKVILDEKDKDNKDDDIYIITDIYNEANGTEGSKSTDTPTLNQVLVYFVEKTNGEVTSIKTSIKNNLSTLLDDVITKYKSQNFQEYILLTKIGEIKGTDLPNFDYNRYLEYIKNSNENYDNESYYYNNWYNSTWN